ncbi:hypothetical protein ACHAQA_007751 [Verticillium albo-atrum]
MAVKEAKENVRPANGLVAPQITYQAPQPQSQPWTRSLMRPSPPTSLPPSLQPQTSVPDKQPLSSLRDPTAYQYPSKPTTTPIPVPTVLHSSPRTQQVLPQHPTRQEAQKKTAMPTPRTDRNIDKVVLGDICFRTWYPSYYGKELLGDMSSGHAGKGGHTQTNGSKEAQGGQQSAGEAGAKAHARRGGGDTPMLDRLYVCPCCFKYSKELVSWLGHVHVCERSAGTTPPGRKIYVHPRGRRTVLRAVPEVKRGPGKKANAGVRHVEEIVRDEGEWSVWEVDGEQDGLFCQNLSLFAKLFLDNKSVFFDVTGFTYFLLVYTPPAKVPANPSADATQAAPDVSDEKPVRPHIVGFFSKEKMSWDNNNLACILVFPPWQRKGLGALLMGVSYEISRREGVLGGPEKPISELGRKGYRRFWGGEIARWLLGIGGIAGAFQTEEETLVDVNDCSKGTWIALDDCIITLREMGLLKDAGLGPGKKPEVLGGDDEIMEDAGEAEEPEPVPDVPRVKLDKEAVRGWVATNGISLERVCDPHGFVEGYAMKQSTPEEAEDEE